MYLDFKNNIKNFKTTSLAGRICPEPCVGQFFLEYIPICNQNAAFSSAFKFEGP